MPRPITISFALNIHFIPKTGKFCSNGIVIGKSMIFDLIEIIIIVGRYERGFKKLPRPNQTFHTDLEYHKALTGRVISEIFENSI